MIFFVQQYICLSAIYFVLQNRLPLFTRDDIEQVPGVAQSETLHQIGRKI